MRQLLYFFLWETWTGLIYIFIYILTSFYLYFKTILVRSVFMNKKKKNKKSVKGVKMPKNIGILTPFLVEETSVFVIE